MPRAASPARATQVLVPELRAQGVECSSRRLEDQRRVGLIPKGHRRSLGRGRGTEVIYPDDMAERMRRGQPWQVVALLLFAAGVELTQETIRGAYRWALTIDAAMDSDELDRAEIAVNQMLLTVAGRQLRSQVAAHLKRSEVALDESPSAVAASVLTNLFLIQLGGEVANDQAMIELLAGLGLPIAELPHEERIEAARLMDAVLGSFSFEELVGIAEGATVDELRTAIPVVAELIELLPAELRALVPQSVAQLLPALLAPVVVHFGRVTVSLFGDRGYGGWSIESVPLNRPETKAPLPLPSPLEADEREMPCVSQGDDQGSVG